MKIKIKKGKHYSNSLFKLPLLNFSGYIEGKVTFLGDFSYYINSQEDTNKLIGLSDSYYHHKDSVRIGWRWDKSSEMIEIMSIIYINGERHIKSLKLIESNKEYDFSIKIADGHYTVHFDDVVRLYNRSSDWDLPNYLLKPYFGGNEKAPKDFRIDIKLT